MGPREASGRLQWFQTAPETTRAGASETAVSYAPFWLAHGAQGPRGPLPGSFRRHQEVPGRLQGGFEGS